VAAILAACAGHATLPADVRPLSRLLTFLVGVTPRAVLAAIEPGRMSREAGIRLSFASTPPRMQLSESAHALYDELLVRLRSANADLCAMTRARDGTAHIEALMDAECNWEAAVTPLAWSDVEEAWAAAAGRRDLDFARDGPFLARLVGDLADAHLIHLELAPGGGIARLWPATAAHAVAAAGPQATPILALAAARLQPLAALLQGGRCRGGCGGGGAPSCAAGSF
jgi:hypothetical protein